MQQDKKDFRTMIGGQALIEGILMRGPKKQAIVLRTDEGLVTKTEELTLIKDKYPILGLPLIRGAVNFVDSMAKSVSAVSFSAEQVLDENPEDAEPDRLEQWLEKKLGSEKAKKALLSVVLVLGIGLSVGLFILLPTLLAGLLARLSINSVARNLIEGGIRITIFLVYLALCARLPDMQRMFAYHGAEHKAIHCYEKRLDLTLENVRKQPRQHPRCGTSFLFVVMIVSILVFSLFRWNTLWMRIIMRLALLPLVVGISYEFNRLVGRYDNALTRALSAPGKALQNITTCEPDDGMIEIAIAALEMVIPEESGEDKW